MSLPNPPTVLIADDNPTNLNVLFSYLSAQGYHVLIAEDGIGAIDQAHLGLPDLILLDVMMPGLDGFETCQQLKESEKTRDIPVIFMTAISETPYIVKAFAVGAVDYITKPLHREEVNARVRTHISIRRLQRELEAEIIVRKAAEAELRKINTGKDVFFSILAHDLKNPISGLLGLSQEMVESLPPETEEKIRDMATSIRNASSQIGELLFDLLSWAQVQMGRLEPVPTVVTVDEQAEFAVALIHDWARKKDIEIVNEITESTAIYCDVRINDTVLRNLLSNAVKFTAAGGTIRLTAEKKEKELVITVADSGKGIPTENIPGLFRLGENKVTFGTAGEKGTGLGLPLCRNIVEKNGGEIWVDTIPGEGSQFHFTVPLARLEADPA